MNLDLILPKTNSTKINQQITNAQTTLLVLLQKLLPLALKSNLSSLLSQRNEIMDLSRRFDLKQLLQNSTNKTVQKMPQQNPVNIASYLTAIHVTPTTQSPTQSTTLISFSKQPMTVRNITPSSTTQISPTTTFPIQHTNQQSGTRVKVSTWRPWYFAASSEKND
jgi:hypothetical protein